MPEGKPLTLHGAGPGASVRQERRPGREPRGRCTITTAPQSYVISQDPVLGPLQNNGGGTDTHALGGGSPAIGVVTAAAECRTPDQRGVPRTVPCDLGAYEAP